MAWIESHQELEKHPKTLDLMGRMGWSLDTTIAKLHRFWWWCVDYAEDGDLRKFNDQQLGAAVGLNGDAEKFVKAMVLACWLDRVPYFRVHDWWGYVGRFLQAKYKNSPEKWEKIRAGCMRGSNNTPKRGSKTELPNQTKPNQEKEEEESPPTPPEGVAAAPVLKKSEGGESEMGIAEWTKRIMEIRPEFKNLPEMEVENTLRLVPNRYWKAAISDFTRDMAGALTLPPMPLKVLAGYFRRAQADAAPETPQRQLSPVARHEAIKKEWNRVMREIVRNLEETAEASGDIGRAMAVARDKYRDVPALDGVHCVDHAIEVFDFRRSPTRLRDMI